MKSKSSLFIAMLAAGLVTSTFGADAEAEIKVNTDDKVRVQTRLDKDSPASDQRRREDQVYAKKQKIGFENRASQLLGKEIWSRKNEKLGVVKDVVVDLPSGKISYVVLGTGGFLGFKEKLIAVPPSELSLNPSEDVFIVDTDRQAIEAMPGFAATNWPLANDSDWGPGAFLKAKERRATQASTEAEVDAKIDTGSRLDSDGTAARLEAKSSTGRPASTVVDRDNSNPSKTRVYETSENFRGEITSLDAKAGIVTVRDQEGARRVFRLEKATGLSTTANASTSSSLRDVRVGDTVEISYHKTADGDMVAHRVVKSTDK